MATFKFEYDHKYSNIKSEFALRVECEIFHKNKEEYSVEFHVINQDDDSEIEFMTLDLRDRAMISDQVWTPPDSAVSESYHDYIDSLQPQYDKYQNL